MQAAYSRSRRGRTGLRAWPRARWVPRCRYWAWLLHLANVEKRRPHRQATSAHQRSRSGY
eukprot:861624-Prymnesium_polylepis.1